MHLTNHKGKYKFLRCFSAEMLVLFLLGLMVQMSMAQEEDVIPEIPEFRCGSENGNFADPLQCRRYYTCTNGKATKRVCPSGLHWDDEKLYCEFKEKAKCGPIVRKKKTKEPKIPKCNRETCQLPFCFCSRNGDTGPVDTDDSTNQPQVIVMTFDGAVNQNNFKQYDEILKITKNNDTNECPIRGTFFVTHNYNNYQMVEHLYSKGQEIAVSSVTGKSLQFSNATVWKDEIKSMKRFLTRYGNVPAEDILGARAPQLNPGDDDQFKVLIEEGFIWDSSVGTRETDLPIWPYTLDYRIPHECKIKSCPKQAYPGFWEIPANLHYNEDRSGGACSYMDQCIFSHLDDEDVFEWLKKDFLRFYESNRAPYLMPFHTNWFTHPHQIRALTKFIYWTLEQPQVYYLTATEVLIWMTEPTEDVLKQLTTSCKDLDRPVACKRSNSCAVPHEVDGESELRYFQTCNECPKEYPWVSQNNEAN